MKLPETFVETEEFLHAAASEATGGLTDFGDPDYLRGLRVLLQALDSDTAFSPQGREVIAGTLTGALSARLRTFHGLRESPRCRALTIRRPLVIIGLPRTGTTALHKMLSMDPQFQGVEFWLGQAPMPRPPKSSWAQQPTYRQAVEAVRQMAQLMPEIAAFHEVTADGIDECLVLLQQSFTSNSWGSTYRVPSYDAWWRRQDERPAYRYLAQALRLIGSNDPDKSWLLKNPGHIWALDLLLEQFPDACLVQTHRDPAQVIPSVCNILASARRSTQAGTVDPVEIAAREISVWSEAIARVTRVRRIDGVSVHDVMHRDFRDRPLDVVEGIYRTFGFELTPEVRQQMRLWLEQNPEGKHGRHLYSAEEFGLSRESIRERFRDYIERFDL